MTRYLTEKEVTLINEAVIRKYTSEEQVGVKDRSLLLSACIGTTKAIRIWRRCLSRYLFKGGSSLCEFSTKSFIS